MIKEIEDAVNRDVGPYNTEEDLMVIYNAGNKFRVSENVTREASSFAFHVGRGSDLGTARNKGVRDLDGDGPRHQQRSRDLYHLNTRGS